MPTQAALQALLPLLRQLRDIKGLQRDEARHLLLPRRAPSSHFHDEAGVLVADLKKAGGSRLRPLPGGHARRASASWSTTPSAAPAAVDDD